MRIQKFLFVIIPVKYIENIVFEDDRDQNIRFFVSFQNFRIQGNVFCLIIFQMTCSSPLFYQNVWFIFEFCQKFKHIFKVSFFFSLKYVMFLSWILAIFLLQNYFWLHINVRRYKMFILISQCNRSLIIELIFIFLLKYIKTYCQVFSSLPN